MKVENWWITLDFELEDYLTYNPILGPMYSLRYFIDWHGWDEVNAPYDFCSLGDLTHYDSEGFQIFLF